MILESQAEKYRKAIAYLDSCGEFSLDTLRETYRIAGVNTPESELQVMWRSRLDLAPFDGKPGGGEALRQIIRDKLSQAIQVFTGGDYLSLWGEETPPPLKPTSNVTSELDRKIAEVETLQKAQAAGQDTRAEALRIAAELRAMASAERRAAIASNLPHQPSIQEIAAGVVTSITMGGYPLVADRRIERIERILDRWPSLSGCEKVSLDTAMRVGRFIADADWLMYLARVEAGRSDAGEERPGFVFDVDFLTGSQRERLEAVRVRRDQLYAGDVANTVAELEKQAGNVNAMSETERREILRRARRIWNTEHQYLGEPQKLALHSIILRTWTSITPKWWEFRLRARPWELGAK